MVENETIEFKQDYTEKIYTEIVAFLNTGSGSIFVGYDDNGNLVGLKDARKIEEIISNNLVQKIEPDCQMFVSINNYKLDNKEFIRIDVLKGIDIYYLKSRGIMDGVYTRMGSCSRKATNTLIKQMIINNSNLSYETFPSVNQNLTFNYAEEIFQRVNINLNDENTLKSLNLKKNNGLCTNVALILSDQNPFSIKVAQYENETKTNFNDQKEFTGSILEVCDKTLDYLKLTSKTYGIIDNIARKDIEEFPLFILRELLLNSIIHRDYSNRTSNIINIYNNKCIEFISYGSLIGNATLEDILAGLSTSRNPLLQAIFLRLKWVDAIGSGLRRVNSYYENIGLKFEIKILPTTFIAIIPHISMEDITTNNNEDDENILLCYIKENGYITRKVAETLLHKEKTMIVNILNTMILKGLIIKKGNGPSTRYELKI